MNIVRCALCVLCFATAGCYADEAATPSNAAPPEAEAPEAATSIHQFTVSDIDGNDVALSDYAGTVVLIVNTASRCGFTRQYAGLEQLYQRYKDKGLVVLGFPANNFGGQEPGSNAEIKSFCSTKFDVTFPLFAKSSVKGDDISPLYAYLTSADSGYGGAIGWNFTKFLVDSDGKVIGRYPSKVEPLDSKLEQAVRQALEEK